MLEEKDKDERSILQKVVDYGSCINPYVSVCWGRGLGGPPTGAFFVAEGAIGGAGKSFLKQYGLSWMPAVFMFCYTSFFIRKKANETYDTHPNRIDLLKQGRKYRDTTETILEKFQNKSEQATLYLEGFQLNTESVIESIRSPQLISNMQLYARLHVMHRELKPHRVENYHQWQEAIKHSLTFFWEYVLEVYFDDRNFIGALLFGAEWNWEAIFGLVILLAAFGSGCQTYYYTAQPPEAVDEEITTDFKDDFFNFREKLPIGYGSMSLIQNPPKSKLPKEELEAEMAKLEKMSDEELVRHYAGASRERRCYYHRHG